MNEDAELLRRYVEENTEAAFSELVRRRIGLVYAIAWRRTRDAHQAKDVTQVVFTSLARKAPHLVRHQTLVGWLYRSAHFAASDAARAALRQKRHEEEAIVMQQLDSPTSEPDWQQLSPVVDEVLSELPAVDRDAVLLRVVDEYSYAEIGRGLGIGDSGARMRVERALEKMREALSRRSITSTAAALTLAIGQQAGAVVPGALASVIASTAMCAAASASGISAVLTFMSTTKVTITALGLVALAAVTFSAYQTRTARQAEAAFALMAAERDQLRTRLAVEDSAGQAMHRSAPAAPKTVDSIAPAAGLSAASVQTLPMKMSAVSDLTNAGQSTPRAAFETLNWAIYHGDIDTLAQMISFAPGAKTTAAKLFESLPADMRTRLQTPENMMALLMTYNTPSGVAYQITGEEPFSDIPGIMFVVGQVKLEDDTVIKPVWPLQQVDGKWQFVMFPGAAEQLGKLLTQDGIPPTTRHKLR